MTENKHFRRSQSAMEYLMTYGWAILIIAVALGLLYVLGVFSPSSATTNSCTSQSGYICTALSLSPRGTVTFQFGQDTGTTLYNLEFTCTALENSAGLPNPDNDFVASPARTVINSQKFYVNVPCYTDTGAQFSSTTLGTVYNGFIWVNYTEDNAPPSSSNPWLTAKIATFSAKTTS